METLENAIRRGLLRLLYDAGRLSEREYRALLEKEA